MFPKNSSCRSMDRLALLVAATVFTLEMALMACVVRRAIVSLLKSNIILAPTVADLTLLFALTAATVFRRACCTRLARRADRSAGKIPSAIFVLVLVRDGRWALLTRELVLLQLVSVPLGCSLA